MYLGLANRLTRMQSETPAFALDLLRGSLDSRVSFSRASGATDIIGGVLTSFATDAPRISAANGLLIEGSRTNQALNSSIAATTACTLTTGQTDPAGGSGAVLLTEDTSASGHQASTGNNIVYSNGTTYVASAFFKKGSCDKVQMFLSSSVVGSGDCYANFDLTNGTVTASGASVSLAALQALGNGWYRCSMRFTTTGGVTHTLAFCTLQTGSEVRAPSFVGTSRSYYLYGAQVEAGAFLSSYIPTTSSAATRAADICTGPVGWVNESEGTLWVEATPGGIDPGAATSPRLVCLTNSGVTSYHELRRLASSSAAQGSTVVAGTAQATMGATAWNNAVTAKAALGWRNNDEAFCFAGGTAATDTATPGGMPTGLTVLRLGANSPTGGFFFGHLRGLRGWTRRLSDSQIKAVTQ
jgi:hypothetical protein